MEDLSAETLTRVIAKALREQDFTAVVAALKLLALKDPTRAALIHDMIMARQ